MLEEEAKPKILIIEDEALVARELKSRLTQMGCEVVGIAYGKEGVELARETRPDLLLADIHLKNDADGIELAKIIKSDHDLPVVFLTAYSDTDTVSRAKAVTPYSFIIKPVENRELQIAIEMALYKFNIERELRETRQLLETALACIGNALVFVDSDERVTNVNDEACQMFGKNREDVIERNWRELFQLGAGSSLADSIESALKSISIRKLAPFLLLGGARGQTPLLIDGIIGPVDSGGVLILRQLSEIHDPIESMPTTEDMLSRLGSDQLAPSESSFCQLLIYSDSEEVKESNHVLEEVSRLLDKVLRSTDLVSAYAGSLLSVSMPYTSVHEGNKIADAILRELRDYAVANDSEVNFSIGLAHSNPGDQQPFELFRRAGWALNIAIKSGGNSVVVWTPESERDIESNTLASSASRDYHNLVLLWNVMSVVTRATDLEDMTEKFCRHILFSFGLQKVAVIAIDQSSVKSLGGIVEGSDAFGIEDLKLTRSDLDQFKRMLSGGLHELNYEDNYLFAIEKQKVLYLKGELSHRDVDFVRTLARYFATGVAGVERTEDRSVEPDNDVEELIVGSPSMEGVLESARLVAPTDATVLVSGESGTGKELLARKIHVMSPRRDKPFIIVDCGAVVESLIESELFGHVKGAFTGASKNVSGRLKEADGGTVLLDEIGELPLDVQVKLLRFVQEREVVAVGSNSVNSVNTRIIAATHRNLEELVNAGKFREDLYYRLNVFAIEMPPLRERAEDVLALARHYLERFRVQYDKDITGFSTDAEQALADHDWPGNVRELVNLINRAVILCKSSTLNTIHLGLFPHESEPGAADDLRLVATSRYSKPTLETRLRALVDRCVNQESDQLPPLGQWLEEDLIYRSVEHCEEALGQAARLLEIPEATLRRKVARMREQYGDGPPKRPENWVSVDSILGDLIKMASQYEQSILDMVSNALLAELQQRGLSKTDAATLMGVSLPTYRRMSS